MYCSFEILFRSCSPQRTKSQYFSIFHHILQDLKAAVTKHEESCNKVCLNGQSMIEQNHYAASDIQMKVKLLQNNFSRVKELVEIRGDRLNDAAQSLQVKPRQFLRLIINTLSYRLISLDMESFLQEYLLVLFLNKTPAEAFTPPADEK